MTEIDDIMEGEKDIADAIRETCGNDEVLKKACLKILDVEKDAIENETPENERISKVRKILEDAVDESETAS